MTAFAYYRLPCEQHATYVAQHVGEPEILSSVAQLNGKEGFVIAPFQPSAECPVVLIHPDEKKVIHLTGENFEGGQDEKNSDGGQNEKNSDGGQNGGLKDENGGLKGNGKSEEKDGYARDYECFHGQLERGVFRKIVLARKSTLHTRLSAEALFQKACRLYPRLFVALVYTEPSGMWLMATPEILLQGNGDAFQTMSLAGTQKAPATAIPPLSTKAVEGLEWPQKDQEEQQYVTDYIEACIRTFSDDYRLQGPYTMTAAHLCHLRTDIHFRLPCADVLGDVLEALYPTPAVCGIPKEPARRFILRHEHEPRRYYSGFVGMLSPRADTHLFVSLRCMRLLPGGICELYAGGGLLKESEMEKEWRETEAKMQTMMELV